MWLFGSRTTTARTDQNNDKDKDTDKESPSPSPSLTKEVSTASTSNSTTNNETASSTQDPKAPVPSATSPTAPALVSSQSTATASSLPSSSSLLDLATAACQSVAADSPQFKKIREVLAVDVNTGVYLDNLKNILTDANFLRRHVPDVFDMRDEEFGLTRDLVCVVLSHLQGRVVTANGFCKTSRTNHITSWRGKCQASGTGGKRTTNAQARRQTVKCHCNFSFHLNREGQIFFKGEHTCPEKDTNDLSTTNKLLSYTLSTSAKNKLLESCVEMMTENKNLKRRDIEVYVDTELRKMGILSQDSSSGSFARLMYSRARAYFGPAAPSELSKSTIIAQAIETVEPPNMDPSESDKKKLLLKDGRNFTENANRKRKATSVSNPDANLHQAPSEMVIMPPKNSSTRVSKKVRLAKASDFNAISPESEESGTKSMDNSGSGTRTSKKEKALVATMKKTTRTVVSPPKNKGNAAPQKSSAKKSMKTMKEVTAQPIKPAAMVSSNPQIATKPAKKHATKSKKVSSANIVIGDNEHSATSVSGTARMPLKKRKVQRQ